MAQSTSQADERSRVSGAFTAAAIAAGIIAVVGIRELSKRTSELVREVEETGEPVVVTRHGRPAATVIPLSAGELANYVLANAPQFVQAMEEAEREAAVGQLTTLAELRQKLGDDTRSAAQRRVSHAASRAPSRATNRPAKAAASRARRRA